MRRLPRFPLLAVAMLACLVVPSLAVSATSRPKESPEVKKMLELMDNSSTWGHPDLWGEFAGMRRYFEGDYAGAIKYFKFGARYGDKLSQATIGMMYLNGDGVAKDPVTACAWLELAAERNYANLVASRDRVCDALTTADRQQAAGILTGLMAEYGDAVAKPRMAVELTTRRREQTGSHIGYDFGVGTVSGTMGSVQGGTNPCGPTMTYGGYPLPCDGQIDWSSHYWNPAEYFHLRDTQWRGTVTVGDLKKPAADAQSHDGVPAPASSSGR